MDNIPMDKFRWGIECENYVPEWRVDHEDTHETVSRIFPKFNSVLVYYRNIVQRHLDDSNFVLHSFPTSKCSSISAHIHLSTTTPNWEDYRWDLYNRLFKLLANFHFFFKNSPKKTREVISSRHVQGRWCNLTPLSKHDFDSGDRHYNALTPNPLDTLEFRYNDVPKSLNQLSLYYYLVYIASNPDVSIPECPSFEINYLHQLDEPLNELFSYNDIESVKAYKQNYKELMLENASKISRQMDNKFYDFYTQSYLRFDELIKGSFDYEYGLFKRYFDGQIEDWSGFLKEKFCKPIKSILIRR